MSAVRLGIAGIAVLAAVSACGSSSSPTPNSAPENTASSPAASSTLPSSPIESSTPAQTSGGSSNFCDLYKEASLSLAGIADQSKISGVFQAWERAAASAPPEIRSDVQTFTTYLQAVVRRDAQAISAQQQPSTDALGKITKYTIKNCIHP